MSEKTLCIIKPDAVENNFEDQINKMGINTLIQEIKIKDDDISTQLASSIIKIL